MPVLAQKIVQNSAVWADELRLSFGQLEVDKKSTASDKLLFILHYLKNNPLQEVAYQWIHRLEALLKPIPMLLEKAFAPEHNAVKVNE